MVLAPRVQAAVPGNGVRALAGAAVAENAPPQARTGAPSADTLAGGGGVQAPGAAAESGGQHPPAQTWQGSGVPSAGAPVADGAITRAVNGSPDANAAPAAAAPTPAAVSQPRAPQPLLAEATAGAGDASGQHSASSSQPSPGALMLARQAQAEVIAMSWLPPGPGEPADSAITPELASLIASFESQARNNSPADAAAVAPQLARADTHQLGLVSVISTPLPAPEAAPATGLALAGGTLAADPRAHGVSAPALGFSRVVWSAPGAWNESLGRLQAARRPLRTASRSATADSGATPIAQGSLPSGSAAAFGGTATGLAAPAAALLVIAAACLLLTRSLGRPPMQLAWKSALLSSRLERPG